MKNPPLVSRERVLEQLFDVEVFPDGETIQDVCAAIQAAFLVDRDFATDLAKRYGLYNNICLRCTADRIASTSTVTQTAPTWHYQLCNNCYWFIHRMEQLRP